MGSTSFVVTPGHVITSNAVVVIALVFGIVVATQLLSAKENADIREPPVIPPGIPVIGHILGFMRHHLKYLIILRNKTNWPILSFNMLGKRTYIVMSPSFTHLALRSKTMSLDPLKAYLAVPLLGLSKQAANILGLDGAGKFHHAKILEYQRVEFNRDLAPNGGLDVVSDSAAAEVARIVNELQVTPEGVDLYHWLRDLITYSTTVALYGPGCPVISEKGLLQDIWTFDEYQLRLITNILPSITARKGFYARQRLVNAFEKYLEKQGDESASVAIRNLSRTIRESGAGVLDNARMQIFHMSVATVNTAPTAIWLVLNVLSNPVLLSKLREELASVTTVAAFGDGEIPLTGKEKKGVINLSDVERSTPLLFATYQEALRLGSTPTCNRVTLEDTVLRDSQTGVEVLLKKGVRVSIATFMLHHNDALWDGSADTFDPYRFIDGDSKNGDEKTEIRPKSGRKAALAQSLVAYGGGVHLCPGRHLAKREILATAALLIMALDFDSADGSAITWNGKAETASGSRKPSKTLIARIRPRHRWEEVEWSIRM